MSQPQLGATRRDNLRGIAIMLVAVGAFSMMDAGLKVLAPDFPLMQVAALRGLATLPLAAVWVAVDGGFAQLWRVRWPLHLLRGVLGIATLVWFTWALRYLPLSTTYAIFFVAPLIITALAVPILKERVGWRRWLVIAVGFAGVLVVLRPTGAGTLTLAGLAVFATAAGYALSAITVRVLGRTDTSQSMVFWLMLMVALGGGALALPEWRGIEGHHWPVLAGIGVTGAVGQYALTEAFRRGQASVIAPFEYTALAWGLGLDWVVWHVSPSARTLGGAAVIIGSGMYLIRHERVHPEAEHP